MRKKLRRNRRLSPSLVRTDIQAVQPRLRYTYFRNELQDQQKVRDKLYDSFNAESAALSSPAGRQGYR